jgi:hypothetical protein
MRIIKMANKVKNGYQCGYCKKFFTDPIECDSHKETHKLIYLALSQEDLNRLVQFIYSKDDRILGGDLVDRLQSYLKGSFITEIEDKGTWVERNISE